MGHIFISYRKSDIALCMEVAGQLREEGFTVWWDTQIKMSANFTHVIEEKLRSADAVITLWTKDSVQSKWVYFETELASQMGKLLPVRLDKCELPVGLDRLQTCDFPIKGATKVDWQILFGHVRAAIENGQASETAFTTLEELTWRKVAASPDPKDVRDFITIYPNTPHLVDAKALLHKLSTGDNLRLALWSVAGVLCYAALCSPLFSLWHDYGLERAMFWFTLYFHYFAFFATFGAIMVLIYCFTLAKALDYGVHRAFARLGRVASRIAAYVLMIGVPFLACLVVTHMETGDGYAPWQFRQSVLSTPIRDYAPVDTDRTLDQIFTDAKVPNVQSLWDARDVDPAQAGHCLITGRSEAPNVCLKAMGALQTALEARLHDDPAALSVTNTVYKASFFFFALTFLGSYFNIFFLCIRSENVRVFMARLAPWGGQRYTQLLRLFAVQLLLIAFWFVARIIFQLETATILGGGSGSNYHTVIRNSYIGFVAVYFVSIGFVIAAAARLKSWVSKIGIVVIASLTAAFLGASFSLSAFCRAMQVLIGGKAGPASLAVLVILLVFIILIPLVLPNILKREEDDINS